MAAFEGHAEMVRMLLREADGIDVNATDANGHTALTLASFRRHLGIIRLLLEAGASDLPEPDSGDWSTCLGHMGEEDTVRGP